MTLDVSPTTRRPMSAVFRRACLGPRYHAHRFKNSMRVRRNPLPATVRTVPTGATPSGQIIRLRRPDISDAAAWRDARIRSRSSDEPFWPVSAMSWEERHTDAAWYHECRGWRGRTRAGTAFPCVIEVDGRFAGQINLEWIDSFNGTAEAGIWVAQDKGAGAVATAALDLILTFAFEELGLHRVTAPIHVDNVRARTLATRYGLVDEGIMRNYMESPGGRGDYVLYSAVPASYVPKPHHTAFVDLPAASTREATAA